MAATKNAKRAMDACKSYPIANVTPADCETLVASHSFIRDAIDGKGTSDPWPFDEMVRKHFAKSPQSKEVGDVELIAMHKVRDARMDGAAVKEAVKAAILDGCTDADTIRNRAGISSRIIGTKQAQDFANLMAENGLLERVVIRRDNYSSASKAGLWDTL